jgi:hypothetical protein
MREESAAVVTPLVWWYRGIHTAGCTFEERRNGGKTVFSHKILYTDIRRKRIDYPENHCILVDRRQVPGIDVFDDVEPFDVDLGLMLRTNGLSVYFEPRSVVTYAAPPPLQVRDIPLFKLRWDGPSWKARNQRFAEKWAVTYEASAAKLASYRRQQLKLGLAGWYPTEITVGISNVLFGLANRLQALTTHVGAPRAGGDS